MSCTKRKFFSKQEAKLFLRTNNSNHRDEEKLTNAYKCLRCDCWHVTHLSKQEGRNLTRIGIIKDDTKVSPELEALRKRFSKNS